MVEHQRRLNPTMKKVVRKEVLMWLDTRVIYLIFYSPWVSRIQVIPKKGGMIMVRDVDNKLIPTRTMTR